MKFTLLVNNAPYQSQSSDSAYHFATAVIAEGHEIEQIFFYFDGVYNALPQAEAAQDDRDPILNWSKLAAQHQLDLLICSTAALKRGVGPELASGFRIESLARLSEAISCSDRLITFGS